MDWVIGTWSFFFFTRGFAKGQIMKTLMKTMLVLVVIALMQVGCGSSVPDTPDGTAKAVMNGIAENKPDIIWEAMPESYRKDVNDLIHKFAEEMDPDVYKKFFSVTEKMEKLLKDKKEFVINSEMVKLSKVKTDDLKKNYDSVVDLIAVINDSDLSNLDQLKSADGGDFLKSSGRDLMDAIATISSTMEEDQFSKEMEKLKNAKVEVISSDEKTAKIKTKVGDDEEEVELVKVDDRWVPKFIADDWDEGVVMLKKQIEEMCDFIDDNKMQAIAYLASVEGVLDAMLAIDNQEEFDASLEGVSPLVMKVLGPMRRSAIRLHAENLRKQQQREQQNNY